MSKRDYYEILGVDKTADESAIKSSYRKLAMQYHPDKNPGDHTAEEKFKEAAEAYEVLSDSEKRKRYDQYGHAGVDNTFGSGGFDWSNFTHANEFEDLFGGFSSIFEQFFGGGFSGGRRGGRSEQANRGEDLRIEMSLSLKEIDTGVTKTIKINVKDTCPKCNGSGSEDGQVSNCQQCNGQGQVRQVRQSLFGQVQSIVTCPSCHGEGKIIQKKCTSCRGDGRVAKSRDVKLEIPAGIAEGQYIRMRGVGNKGLRGGPNGDILVLIHEKEDDVFEREGAHLICEYPISFSTAALGGDIMVTTQSGEKLKLKIPAGTQTGKILKLRGKGLPEVNNNYRGDIIVKVDVVTPTNLNAEEIKHFEALRAYDEKRNLKPDKGFWSKIKDIFQ